MSEAITPIFLFSMPLEKGKTALAGSSRTWFRRYLNWIGRELLNSIPSKYDSRVGRKRAAMRLVYCVFKPASQKAKLLTSWHRGAHSLGLRTQD